MAGTLTLGVTDPERGAGAGGAAMRMRATILIPDVRAFVADASHPGEISGFVDFAPWGTGIRAHGGKFQLFVPSADPELKRMIYELAFEHNGKPYYLAGWKDVRSGPVTRMWRDTSTLFTQLHEGADASGPVIGAGILRLGFADFVRLLCTFRSPGASSWLHGLTAIAIFVRFFLGELWASYGPRPRHKTTYAVRGINVMNAKQQDLVSEYLPIFGARRELSCGPLERFEFKSGDDKTLLLHHAKGGSGGPIVLSPGTAMTALSYCVDTVPQNLVEFLFEKGFDVWLFDWRTSPLLSTHRSPYTFDDVARYDWPAAINQVRERTGQKQVTILAHCLSSPCLLLSLLRGYTPLEHVRKFAASAVALHLKVTTAVNFKAVMHMDKLLPAGQMLHQKHADETAQLGDLAVSVLAEVQPMSFTCDNRACYRQAATFGELIYHSRVEPATHGLMGELVPECVMGFLKDVATGIRSDCLLRGDDWQHLDRLRLPILFMSGSENRMFIPASTEATYQMLCQANGSDLYRREVYEGFGHLDCYLGTGAPQVIWPDIASQLN